MASLWTSVYSKTTILFAHELEGFALHWVRVRHLCNHVDFFVAAQQVLIFTL